MLTAVEGSTRWYTFKLKKEDGTPMPGSSLTHIYATLYEAASQTVINGRSGTVDYLGTEMTVDVDGVYLWEMKPADNVYVGSGVKEVHRLVLKIMWAPDRVFYHKAEFEMENIPLVPAV